MCLKKGEPIKGYPWSWPFLDIFTFKRQNSLCYIRGTVNEKTYPLDLFYPLRKAKFENTILYIPNKANVILNIMYGNDWSMICKSGCWNHSQESHKKSISLPCNTVLVNRT